MKSKLLITFFLISTFGCQVFSQQPKFIQAHLEEAIVYFNSAELKHRSSVEIPIGVSEVVISNIANYVNQSTIQIGANNGVTVMSVQYSNDYIEEYDSKITSPLIKEVKDSITIVKREIIFADNQLLSIKMATDLLDANNKVISTNTSTAVEVEKLLEYYYKKKLELLNSIDVVQIQKEKLVLKLTSLEQRLELNAQGSTSNSKGKFIVQLNSSKAQKVDLSIIYLTPMANWKPLYEVKVNQINTPLQIVYKADVRQSSGIDWSKVKLSLTSGVANQNYSIPVLDTWFVDYLSEIKTDFNRGRIKTASSSDYYEVSNEQVFASADASNLMSKRSFNATINDYINVNETSLNVSFNIDIPYNILSNNKSHSVALTEFSMESEYKYYSAPKVDLNVYLVASIKNYSQYNLLPGEANILFEGVNVGKTFLNPESSQDDLKINIGKDPRIVIKRELLKDKSGTKLFSSRKEQSFLYKIDVRNNKSQSINIEIEDQFPVSKNNDIEVDLMQKSNGVIDLEKGRILWEVNVKSNTTKQIDFGYMLKYNKDKEVR